MSFIKKGKKNIRNYIPKNPQKYKGRYPILTRSKWEYRFCQWLDVNPNIPEWNSEGIAIRYYDPIQMKNRRYYPDFFIKNLNNERFLIEIKPNKETKLPTKTGRKSQKTQLYQEATYLTNQAKFKAAENFCKKMGYSWKLLTERDLFK